MRVRIACFVAAALLAVSVSARADNVETFNVSGSVFNSTAVSGTVAIDTTTGVVESGDLSYGGENFDVLYGQASFSDYYQILFTTSSGMYPYLNLLIPDGSLVGFGGDSLCALDTTGCGSPAQYSFYKAGSSTPGKYFASGALTGATPEPSSLMLLGTGVLGFAGVVKRRFA